jgi:hypothetical protein
MVGKHSCVRSITLVLNLPTLRPTTAYFGGFEGGFKDLAGVIHHAGIIGVEGEGFAVGFDVVGSPQYAGVGKASLKETRFGILSVIVAHLPIEQRWREPNRLTID